MEEQEFVICVLTSLPESFDHWVGRIDLTTIKDSANVIARIIQQDKKNKVKPNSDETVLAFRNKAHSSGNYKPSQQSYRDGGGCFECGDPRHRSHEHRNNCSYSEKQKQANFERLIKFVKKPGYNRANVALTTSESKHKGNSDIAFIAQPASIKHVLHMKSWLLDTGASCHIVNDKSLFHTYEATPGHRVTGIGIASGEGHGTVKISIQTNEGTNTVTLNDALYLPSSPYNLISFGHIHRKGFKLKFSNHSTLTSTLSIEMALCSPTV
jgi:hypothetical protein